MAGTSPAITKSVMIALHGLLTSEATPFFERLCAGMTERAFHLIGTRF